MITKYLNQTVFTGIILVFALLTGGSSLAGQEAGLEELYLEARLTQVTETVEKSNYETLSLQKKLLYIQGLTRSARRAEAEKRLKPLLASHPGDPDILAAAGAIAMASGDLEGAGRFLGRALRTEPGNKHALMTDVLLRLYLRDFDGAKTQYEKLVTAAQVKGTDNYWKDSTLLFLVGIDVYRACRDPQNLRALYRARARRKKRDPRWHQRFRDNRDNLKANASMHKRAGKNRLFHAISNPYAEKIALSFKAGKTPASMRFNRVHLSVGDQTFNVLLDTGNATGWMVHNRDLRKKLKPRTGGRTITQIGTESGMLDGFREYYKTVDFDTFTIRHLNGIYVPKPHPDFPDANLNPAFLTNHVVTLDFIKRELVLRTKEEFEEHLARISRLHYTRLPWYGYKFSFIPVEVNGKKGLAMLETGAEDIALKQEFVNGLGLPLKPKTKYLANGKVVHYHQAEVTVNAGRFNFKRSAADVWPLNRFFNRLTGLSADVVIGPAALKGHFLVSFDPFDRQVVLEKF